MKLISVKIENYKSIFDSSEFLLSDVTCLVGKNESGKTAILQSLYKLNPVEENMKNYDRLEEYPRSILTEYEEKLSTKENIGEANVLTTTWELNGEEIKLVEALHGGSALLNNIVIIKKGYDNIQYWTINFDEKQIIENYLSKIKLDKRKYKDIYDSDNIKSFIEKTKAVTEEDSEIKKLINIIDLNIPKSELFRKPIDVLSARLPKLIYFSEYYLMPGKMSLEELKRKKRENRLDIKDKVFISLLNMANTTPEEIDNIDKFERLQAKLQAVSIRLSKEIFNYWSQNENLKVEFRYDAARAADPSPFNTGYIFRTFIHNTTHEVSINFDERSSGFVWFFSFLVWFSQIIKNYGNNLIILLDEPALNLHAKAQSDLLRYIDEKLKPYFQVLYSTHSPFMVDPNNLSNTRTVEDILTKEKKVLGTKVNDNIYTVDKETLFPLQAAMGYDITQSLFIGKNSLLVEGPSDLIYINWISKLLKENKREYLTPSWTITPVGGLDKIGSFIALFGANNLNIAVLTDYHTGDKTKVRTLKETDLLKSGHFFSAEMFIDQDEADIEDLLGRELYIELINESYSLTGKNKMKNLKTETTPIRVIEDVKNHFRTLPPTITEFDHFSPSLYLLNNSVDMATHLTGIEEAKNRFEEIFKKLNSLLKT